MVTVKVYVEGGGDAERIKSACHEGFSKFFAAAGLGGIMPRIVVCGGRGQAMDRFRSAVQQDTRDEKSVLLVDSEDSVPGICGGATALRHLDARDGKNLQPVTTPEKCHMMVQVMETWFLCDHPGLATFYKQGFNGGGLYNTVLEDRSKRDVFANLSNASRFSQTKGSYGKGLHSFALLAHINATAVLAQCPWAARLVTTLSELKRGQPVTQP